MLKRFGLLNLAFFLSCHPLVAFSAESAGRLGNIEVKTANGRELFDLSAAGVLKLGNSRPSEDILKVYIPYATANRGSQKYSYDFAGSEENAVYLCSIANSKFNGKPVFETLLKAESQTVIERTKDGFELQKSSGDVSVLSRLTCREF